MAGVESHDWGEPWDDSDIKALRKYMETNLTVQQIADLMGRTWGGVNSKIYRLRRDGLL